jgi:hypothetical protein
LESRLNNVHISTKKNPKRVTVVIGDSTEDADDLALMAILPHSEDGEEYRSADEDEISSKLLLSFLCDIVASKQYVR